jgi:hypothetical protein
MEVVSDKEKINSIKQVLDSLISTCKSEILISNKLIEKAKSKKEKNKEYNNQMFWHGKLEVAEYIRYIYLD